MLCPCFAYKDLKKTSVWLCDLTFKNFKSKMSLADLIITRTERMPDRCYPLESLTDDITSLLIDIGYMCHPNTFRLS